MLRFSGVGVSVNRGGLGCGPRPGWREWAALLVPFAVVVALVPARAASGQCKCCPPEDGGGVVGGLQTTGPGGVVLVRVKWYSHFGETECGADILAMAALKIPGTGETLDMAFASAGVSGCSGEGVVLPLKVPCDLDVDSYPQLRVETGLGRTDDPLGLYVCTSQTLDLVDTPWAVAGPLEAAPTPNDRRFVWENPDPLWCQFRCEAETIEFEIPVTRYVGITSAEGTLAEAEWLVQNGLARGFAELTIQAWDVDDGEIDEVSINGERAMLLTGESEQWDFNSFLVPLELVRFPAAPGPPGVPPEPAMNTVTISVDTGEGGYCTAVAWASLKIAVASPVVLIHGSGQGPDFFDKHGSSAILKWYGVVVDQTIDLPKGKRPDDPPIEQPTVPNNAQEIKSDLRRIARRFGVDSVHVVAHSKGGLDAREYLAEHQSDNDHIVRVLSLTTLSTPHNGSVLADIKSAREYAKRKRLALFYEGFEEFVELVNSVVPYNTGYPYLETVYAFGFNTFNVPKLETRMHPKTESQTVFSAACADADRDLGGGMSGPQCEVCGLEKDMPELAYLPESVRILLINPLYRTLMKHSYITMRRQWWRSYKLVAGPQTGAFPNDTLVTTTSGLGHGSYESLIAPSGGSWVTLAGLSTGTAYYGRNHSTVADEMIPEIIIPWIKSAEENHLCGDLKRTGETGVCGW